MSKLLVFTLIVIYFNRIVISSEELLSVVVLYRHGDRAPIKSYKNDIYDASYWPDNFGQLTNVGKEQHYALGKWFRRRYDGFLPRRYNRRDIKILSSNIDRCLMSAAANLAGLYPPENDQVWNMNIGWQPIPIHTMPEEEDALLAQHKPCPKYDRLYDQLMRSEMFENIYRTHSDLLEYVTIYSGEVIKNFNQLKDLYNILYVEDLYNLTLPLWTREVFPEKLERICNFWLKTYTYNTELAILKSGPLIDYIASHLEKVAAGVSHAPKFLMLSAHDTTIAHLLNSLNVYDEIWPPYASSVIFELKNREDYYVVNVFYKNSTDAMKISLPYCDFDCNFDVFVKLVQGVRINLENWQEDCLEG